MNLSVTDCSIRIAPVFSARLLFSTGSFVRSGVNWIHDMQRDGIAAGFCISLPEGTQEH